jgi:hypothetical protein
MRPKAIKDDLEHPHAMAHGQFANFVAPSGLQLIIIRVIAMKMAGQALR